MKFKLINQADLMAFFLHSYIRTAFFRVWSVHSSHESSWIMSYDHSIITQNPPLCKEVLCNWLSENSTMDTISPNQPFPSTAQLISYFKLSIIYPHLITINRITKRKSSETLYFLVHQLKWLFLSTFHI